MIEESRYNNQASFTEKMFKFKNIELPLSDKDKIQWTKEYLLCIVDECMEVLEQLDWKHHKPEPKQINIDNLGIELIDIQKFLWGLCKIWDITEDKFNEYYDLKTIEVESLFAQNNILPALSENNDICIIDIDGVLNYYPTCFYEWINKKSHTDYKTLNITQLEAFKHEYRESGVKKYLKVNEDSKNALKLLKNKGFIIVLLTNRPYAKYKRIYSDTIYWLNTNHIPYDFIFWNEDKKVLTALQKCKNINFIIDDNEQTCKDFSSVGIKSYLFGKDINSIFDIKELNGY